MARSQPRARFGQLLTKVPDIEVGEPESAPGNFIRIVERLPGRIPWPAAGPVRMA